MIRLKFEDDTAVDLPQLTVLIGPNGSGKTRLMQSFDPIHADPNQRRYIAKFDSSGEVTPFHAVYSQQMAGDKHANIADPRQGLNQAQRDTQHKTEVVAREQRQRILSDFETIKAQRGRMLLEQMRQRYGLEETLPPRLLAGEPEELAQAIAGDHDPVVVLAQAKQLLDQVESDLAQLFRGAQGWKFDFGKYVLDSGRTLRASSAIDLLEHQNFGSHPAFAIRITEWIDKWRAELTENDLLRTYDGRAGTQRALSDETFEKSFGQAPWEIINRSLEEFKLPYAFAAPDVDSRKPYHPSLIRTDGQNVPIGGLSSGEVVLFKLALSLIQSDANKVNVTYPDLLLLDEVDASLDPRNLQGWLSAITNVIVEKMGAHVIIATHSPITAALVPEESLYEIIDGDPVPRKISQRQAVDQLTVGLPTLSVDYSGQRQIFTESETDAAIMQELVAKMKGELHLPLSLNFIRTGVRHKGGETNAGCAVVRHLVQQMQDAGNRSVRGMIDWDNDANNVSEGAIHVLGEGTHYAIENILLDPVLVAGLLILFDKLPDVDHTFISMASLEPEDMQALCDRICPALPGNDTGFYEAEYFGGRRVSISNNLRSMNGHELEKLWVEQYPGLRQFNDQGRRGKLGLSIVTNVIGNMPVLCPKPLSEMLVTLASGPN